MLVGMGKYYLFNKLLQSLIQETQCERSFALIEGEQRFSEIWDNLGGGDRKNIFEMGDKQEMGD